MFLHGQLVVLGGMVGMGAKPDGRIVEKISGISQVLPGKAFQK